MRAFEPVAVKVVDAVNLVCAGQPGKDHTAIAISADALNAEDVTGQIGIGAGD